MKLQPRAATSADGFTVEFPSEVDIVMFRTFKAPRALVWDMWTKPEHVRRWWGPHGFENESIEMDLRPGGTFRLGMRAPDGTPCPCEGTFVEIIDQQRLVYDGLPHVHPCGSGLPPRSRVTITFSDEGADTRIVLHARMLSADGCRAAIDQGFATGWQDGFERMEDVAREGRFEIISTRRFSADPATLFGLYADPARLSQWWGPDGFTSSIPVFDFRPGGEFRIIMHGPDGRDHDNHKRFVDIVENERIVFDHIQPTHMFRMSVEFRPEGGGTELIWRMDFARTEQEELLKTFLPQANDQNFDRLAALLNHSERPEL